MHLFSQNLLIEIWELALATKYSAAPVWVHGDVAVGNLLVKDGKLCGVIDFGTMGVGDPSSDLVMAWNFFDSKNRKLFLDIMSVDEGTVNRARGWALWKALITYDWNEKDSALSNWGRHVVDILIDDYGRK